MFALSARWLSITGLGSAVVPEESASTEVASGSSVAGEGDRGRLAPAWSARAAAASMRRRAPVRCMARRVSSSVSSGLSGTTVAPAPRMP